MKIRVDVNRYTGGRTVAMTVPVKVEQRCFYYYYIGSNKGVFIYFLFEQRCFYSSSNVEPLLAKAFIVRVNELQEE